ncbi:MarR family winged helix-turn-helix transcriptional regulator [Staphylococcus petrasii]|uniref:MarR family winged helix-turn-helix transcriptional regulator n=1 Tax=Staphylococcus petrasii TaxID=1276936 RepID=UPI000CD22C81|nr:MarR family transcriptional regulator [Staphylococcus petrasii]PNZ84817.1 MarR family transcriptional regulator [Staphylococcus petrasii]TGA81343.1 MarR family transcriptional regulator [Staphylococcus petrasii]SUM58809.1 transcriptional regulator [Staphylococcus petrasii]
MEEKNMTLANQLCFSAYNVSRLFAKFYEQQLKPFGLTYSQYLVLLALWEHDNQPLHEIGKQLDLSSNTLTPLLKRLEQAGWIKRERSEADKRQLMVSLTAKGQEQQEAVFEAVAKCLPPELDEAQYNEAKDVMNQLEQSLKALTTK